MYSVRVRIQVSPEKKEMSHTLSECSMTTFREDFLVFKDVSGSIITSEKETFNMQGPVPTFRLG